MSIPREVGITEVWLDSQANLAQGSFPRVPSRVWASEIAKAFVWFAGLVAILILLLVLAPESRGDAIKPDQVAHYLDQNTVIPLAVGVDLTLANNLLNAQTAAWGNDWLKGSLKASENAVLRAIGLYVWDGGPTMITDEASEPGVWIQSRIAIDPRLTGGFSVTSVEFGEQPVSTPEPGVWLSLVVGLLGLVMIRWGTRRTVSERIVTRLRTYRAVRT